MTSGAELYIIFAIIQFKFNHGLPQRMKFISPKLVVIFMLLAVFKPVAGLSMESDTMTTAGETFCLMFLQQDEIIKNCHSDVSVKKNCCSSSCHTSHGSLLSVFGLAQSQPIFKNLPFKAILANINSLYYPPSTPPPIQA